jgi:CDP-paratose 2-epimerase
VYRDLPNTIRLKELGTRWEYDDPAYEHGIPETFPVHQSKDSLFGARYFGMPTYCLRVGCLTGPNHSGVELHGFLSYLVKCNLRGRDYRVRI